MATFHPRQNKVIFILGPEDPTSDWQYFAWHRQGVGRQLFRHVEGVLSRSGCVYLTAKTVAETHPDAPYAATQSFYESLGFLPVEVFPTLWGEANPCLLMIKEITADTP